MPDPSAANLHWWNNAVDVHLASEFYDVEGWLAEGRGPRAHESAVVGDVTGLDLVHLQCHFGKDTLSWARVGARVTGLDFSPAAIAAAENLSVRAELTDRARFVCSPVYDAVDVLGRASFDLVYVSLGALCWLADVDRWAAQVAGLLRPGGRLFVHEVHPVSWALADGEERFVAHYFCEREPFVDTVPGSYADLNATDALPGDPTYTWNHSIGEVVNALIAHGMRIDRLDEHDWTSFARFPWMERLDAERFVTPPGRLRVPLSFTVVATLV